MKRLKFFALIAIIAIVATTCFVADFSIIDTATAITFAIMPAMAVVRPNAMQVQRMRQSGIYTGEGDLDLEFADGQANSFLDELSNMREFALKITNNTSSTKKILLFPGYFNTTGLTTSTVTIGETEYTFITGLNNHNVANVNARGIAVDAMIGDGTIATDIDCLSLSAGNIEDFINFIKNNPTRISEMVLASNNTAQYNRKMVIKRIHPGKVWGSDDINLQRYFQVSQYRDEKITINTSQYNLQLDDQTLLYIEVEGKVGDVATTLDLTLKLGASYNQAMGLFQRAEAYLKGMRNALIGK